MAAGLLASLTAVIVTVTLDLAKRWGLSDGTANVILFPINATTFYLIGHLAFEKWVWRQRIIQSLLGIPDLNGQWECLGKRKSPGRKRNPLLEWHCDDHTDLGKDQGVPEHRTVQFAQQICVIGQRPTGIRTDVQLPE